MPGKKNQNNQMDTSEEIIRNAIALSREGSNCAHNRGAGCSVEHIHIKESSILPDISKEQMETALRYMLLARKSDEKHFTLVKQGKSFFHIGCSGHEAMQVAIGMALKQKHDWGWTYYRDAAFAYAMGMTAKEYFLLATGKPEDPSTGGRQMPGHYGNKKLNMPTSSSSTGTQYLNAVGTALASKKLGTDEVTYVSSGEGTTSQGEFYEAVNWASREKLPVLFAVQDNGYAISVPREKQSMGGNVAHTFCCYSNLKMKTFDGTNFFEAYKAAKDAVVHIRSGKGPVLLHGMVERLVPHSSSDDQRKYRKADELEFAKKEKDCIEIFKKYLLANNIFTSSELETIDNDIKKEVDDAADWALSRPDAKSENSTKHIFADIKTRDLNYSVEEPKSGEKVVMVDAINHALSEELTKNEKMLVFGQDIADPKGGVFTATKGLSKFGEERVFNSPLAEASIIGVALGLAVRGFKPVVEIQFGDYIWPAFQQIRNEVATMRFRSDGNFSAPVVIRTAVGGYIHGGLCHSQNIEGFFSHIPGLLIAYPSTASDAKGLLKTACRLSDPVLFLEHKGLYRLPYSTTIEPDENYLIPFGKGKIVKSGSDLTIVTWGMAVKDSLNAAKEIEKNTNKTIEIIDLRTIIPWDKELVFESIKKNNRVLVVHEDTKTNGFGGEIAATIAEEAFRFLDAPVIRHAAKDSHIPFAPAYELDVLPTQEKIEKDIQRILSF
jgi:2-oxoisovalerate dehydrogenase E1 component